jgi:uncharacterized protein (UPF0333 family)
MNLITLTLATLLTTTLAYRLQLFDTVNRNHEGVTRIHDAGGSGSLACWDLTATASNKAAYVSWSVDAGERCTVYVYDKAGCKTFLVQYTGGSNSELPSQYNNVISSYKITYS